MSVPIKGVEFLQSKAVIIPPKQIILRHNQMYMYTLRLKIILILNKEVYLIIMYDVKSNINSNNMAAIEVYPANKHPSLI